MYPFAHIAERTTIGSHRFLTSALLLFLAHTTFGSGVSVLLPVLPAVLPPCLFPR